MWFQLAPFTQFGFLFLLGAVVGGQVNRGIYRLAWFARPIGPWSAPDPAAPSRHWLDRVPIVGWWGLRREASLHGAGYWVRPLLIELGMGLGFVGLYWWEMGRGLIPAHFRGAGFMLAEETILAQFLIHAVLMSLMAVATFIDFDEKTIPDSITLPGVLILLLLTTVLIDAHLPEVLLFPPPNLGGFVRPVRLTSPFDWPAWLDGPRGVLIGMACFCGWCYALLPRTWTTRRGWRNAFRFLLASHVRGGDWVRLLIVAVIGCVAIAGVWWWDVAHWRSLLTSLVGMAFGGGMIWSVRIVGTAVLEKEAMGFGDVTLMAMIGAYVGWQASVITFFFAPFAALVISLAYWLVTRRREIAFGPYLCAAATLVIVRWDLLWHGWAQPIFRMGWYLIGVLFVCVAAMGLLLMVWRFISDRLFN